MGRLEGRRVLVTGSTAGIGRAIAEQILAEGGEVVVHGTREDAIRETAGELAEKAGREVGAVAADLTSVAGALALMEGAVAFLGGLDGLVNNAGLFPRHSIDSASPEAFDTIFAVNARAPMLLIQAAMPCFREIVAEKGRASVVNIGSINAHCGQPDLLIYSMSKGALQTMTRNLGDALGEEGVRVNQLNVGWTYTETEHRTQQAQGRPHDWLEQIPRVFAPSGSILAPEEIAPHVVFWLSDESYPVTGQVYEIEQYPLIGRNRVADS